MLCGIQRSRKCIRRKLRIREDKVAEQDPDRTKLIARRRCTCIPAEKPEKGFVRRTTAVNGDTTARRGLRDPGNPPKNAAASPANILRRATPSPIDDLLPRIVTRESCLRSNANEKNGKKERIDSAGIGFSTFQRFFVFIPSRVFIFHFLFFLFCLFVLRRGRTKLESFVRIHSATVTPPPSSRSLYSTTGVTTAGEMGFELVEPFDLSNCDYEMLIT